MLACGSNFEVLPAYAGMIPHWRALKASLQRAPRVCGDDPPNEWTKLDDGECSPRMRG